MANFYIISTAVIVLFVGLSSVSYGYPPERKCRTVFTDINKRELTNINVCIKELGYKTGREKSQKSTCTMKCVLQKDSLIQQDGNLSREQFDIYISEHFPESLAKRANDTFTPCLDLFEGKDINVNDEFCKPYDPLVKCLSRNFSNLCRGLP